MRADDGIISHVGISPIYNNVNCHGDRYISRDIVACVTPAKLIAPPATTSAARYMYQSDCLFRDVSSSGRSTFSPDEERFPGAVKDRFVSRTWHTRETRKSRPIRRTSNLDPIKGGDFGTMNASRSGEARHGEGSFSMHLKATFEWGSSIVTLIGKFLVNESRHPRTSGSNQSGGLWFFKENHGRVPCRVSREAQSSEPKFSTHNELVHQRFPSALHMYCTYACNITHVVRASVSVACYRRDMSTVR